MHLVGQPAEYQGRVDACQKFRPEGGSELGQDVLFDLREIQVLGAKDVASAYIGREDDIEVGEVEGLVDPASNAPRVEDREETSATSGFAFSISSAKITP